MNLIIPQKKKFIKSNKGRNYGSDTNHNQLIYFKFGIVAVTRHRLQNTHMEMYRVTIRNFFKRDVEVRNRVAPNRTDTAHPKDSRMGGGKGTIEQRYYNIKPCCIFVEFSCENVKQAIDIARIVGSKLPFKTKLVYKNEMGKTIPIGETEASILNNRIKNKNDKLFNIIKNVL